MRTHVNVIAWLHIAFGILTTFASIVAGSLFLSMGHAFEQTSMVKGSSDNGAHFINNPVAGIGTIYLVIGLVIGIPGIVAGIGMLRLRPWGRILGVIVSILDIISMSPIHLALGVYGLVILLNQETASLFNRGTRNLVG